MARVTAVCLVLLTASLYQDVIGFALRKRHSRSTDLADALRMLERQRSRLDKERSQPSHQRLTISDFEPWVNAAGLGGPDTEEDSRAVWLARSLGLDQDYDKGFSDVIQAEPPAALRDFLREPPIAVPAPVQVAPTDKELDAIFGEKSDADEGERERERVKKIPKDMEKKSKERTSPAGDGVPRLATRADVSALLTSNDEEDLTRDEFKALLKAVEKLQNHALVSAEREKQDEEDVALEVGETIAEARHEAEAEVAQAEVAQAEVAQAAAVEEVAREAAKEALKEAQVVKEVMKEAEEAKEAIKEAASLTPKPQPVSPAELDSLFEGQKDDVKEVIPTENGGIVRTEKTLKDLAGRPVGREETVEQVGTLPGKAGSFSSLEDLWYLQNYLNQEGDRKKRNSKRSNSVLPSAHAERMAIPEPAVSVAAGELLQAYVAKISQLQSQLDQARLVSYLEGLENDILTDALNEATVSQVKGHISPEELSSLQDAIKVEESLQQVKVNSEQAADLAHDLSREISEQYGLEKRGEPWQEHDDAAQSQNLALLTEDGDDDVGSDDNHGEEEEEEKDEETSALEKWFDINQKGRVELDDIFGVPPGVGAYRADDADDDIIQEAVPTRTASLFTNNAHECPAVKEFGSNCEFAGTSIDFEARALCNMHEMCYACGRSLDVTQGQCDFIYRTAATMLCQEEDDCTLEAEVFLNSMKLKHRYVPYTQKICRSKCTAQFLSII